MLNKRSAHRLVLGMVLAMAAQGASAGTIPFTDFFVDGDVTLSNGDLDATLSEGTGGFTTLNHDPFFDTPLIMPTSALTELAFDYVFDEPAGNFDRFDTFLVDASGATVANTLASFETSAAGTLVFDVSAFIDDVIGIYFDLISAPGGEAGDGMTSTVTISDLRLQAAGGPQPVPAPAMPLLLGLGLLLASVLRRRR